MQSREYPIVDMVQRTGRSRPGRTAQRRSVRALTRTACAVAAIALGAIVSGALPAAVPSAGADPAHVWNGLAFRAGTVCSTGDGTSPLASWNLGGGYSAAYLVTPVAESAGIDTAVPPLASLGPQSSVPVSSTGGSVGQLDAAQVPGVAALLARYGPTGDDATAAALAHLIMTKVGGTSAQVPSCSDAAIEARLQSQAAALAGPYSVDFTGSPAPAVPGRASSVSATVTGAAGSGVPGTSVTFTAGTPVFGGSTSARATTDASGRASARFTLPAATATAGVSFTATATVPTSLTAVSIQATPSATNPSGTAVAALVPAAPSSARATTSVPVDRSAHPKLSLSADPSAALRGASITPTLDVTGLNGHAATATVTTLGPLPLTDRTLCSSRTGSDFSGSRVAGRTSTVDVAADGVVRAAPWTAAAAGCYFATARLTTTDATPQATASASTAHAVTVLDTAVSARLGTPLVGRGGSSDVTLQLQRTHSVPMSVSTVVTGPVVPGQSATGCGSVDYSGAPTSTQEATPRATSGDRSRAATTATGSPSPSALPPGTSERRVTVRSPGLGCSRVQTSLVLHAGGQDLTVAVPPAGTADLLTIAPKVQVAAERSWGQTGATVTVRTTVSRTFNQPGHVTVHLLRTASSEFGCGDANFAHAPSTPAGVAVAVDADYAPVSARSAVLTGTGCYRPVAVLHMDANTEVSATTAEDTGAVIAVGLDPSATSTVRTGSRSPDGVSIRPIVISLIVFLLLVLVAIVATLRLAREPEPDAGPVEPLELRRPSPGS